MHFGKRPTVFAVLLLSLCFLGFGHRTLAMDFTERNGNLVTQNGESIRVARTHGGKVAVQLQHVPSSNRWYLRLQDLKRAADSQFGPITLVNGSRTLTLQPQSDATGRTYPAGVPGLDRWYLLTPDEAAQLSVPSKDWKLEAVKNNGKAFSEKLSTLPRLIQGLQAPNQKLAPYGPMYSVFYPGMAPEKVRDAFLLFLNDKVSFPFEYRMGDHPLACELFKTESSGNFTGSTGYARFSPQDGGTWVDMDFSQSWYVAGYTTKYGYVPPQSGISTSLENDFVDHIFQAAQTTYRKLEPHNDYGITLKGTFTSKSPTIQTVDTAKHPELAAVRPGDRLTAINGAKVSQRNYLAQYLLDYSPAGTPLTLTLEREKGKPYTVQVKPVVEQADDPDADYASLRALGDQDYRLTDKDKVPEMTNIGIFYAEKYDPLAGAGDHIDCPTVIMLKS